MKILITGALGFIGQNLVRKLLKRQDIKHLCLVDSLINASIDECKDILLDKRVFFIEKTVAEMEIYSHYDEIYHLASPVGCAGVLNYAGRMGNIIISDTLKMAELALETGAKLLNISTSEVYGKDPGNIPQKEDIDKIVPANVTIRLEYGVAKLLSEISLLNLAKVTPLKVNIVRPFNIVGIGQKSKIGFIIPRFVEAALKNEPLTIFSGGNQKRTFTSVYDIVDGIELIMNSNSNGEIYNIGNPNNLHTILEVAQKVIKLSGSKSKLEFTDGKAIYGKHYEEAWNKIPNIDKISGLGWKPKYSLDEILTEIIESARGL